MYIIYHLQQQLYSIHWRRSNNLNAAGVCVPAYYKKTFVGALELDMGPSPLIIDATAQQ